MGSLSHDLGGSCGVADFLSLPFARCGYVVATFVYPFREGILLIWNPQPMLKLLRASYPVQETG